MTRPALPEGKSPRAAVGGVGCRAILLLAALKAIGEPWQVTVLACRTPRCPLRLLLSAYFSRRYFSFLAKVIEGSEQSCTQRSAIREQDPPHDAFAHWSFLWRKSSSVWVAERSLLWRLERTPAAAVSALPAGPRPCLFLFGRCRHLLLLHRHFSCRPRSYFSSRGVSREEASPWEGFWRWLL